MPAPGHGRRSPSAPAPPETVPSMAGVNVAQDHINHPAIRGAILLHRRAHDAGAISPPRPSHNDEGVFVIMAGQEVISPQIKTLSAGEAIHLADRLYSRSISKMFVASPEVCIDLCMASRVIRSLINQVDRLASECEDRAHL